MMVDTPPKEQKDAWNVDDIILHSINQNVLRREDVSGWEPLLDMFETFASAASLVKAGNPAFLLFREGPLAPIDCIDANALKESASLADWIGWFPKIALRDLASAPRDGTAVFVFDRQGRGIEARVVANGITDEFIPASIPERENGQLNSDGMNHGAISNDHIAGWLPLPACLEGTTDVEELQRRLPKTVATRSPRRGEPIVTTDANADLMAPIAEILNASEKDLPTKVAVLVDCAAALLATHPPMRVGSELRETSEEMRKRLIRVARAFQSKIDARQATAKAVLAELANGSFVDRSNS